ncbi:unnamed protein product [Soboliphyme baturini]|uniref:Uncharacterized protein n=1 Tax=Soboliphyme baturini TaxID=241478 RepID=A0A183IA53_9BILA|nr:unnamed protein product [Soboliphyme baturini]
MRVNKVNGRRLPRVHKLESRSKSEDLTFSCDLSTKQRDQVNGSCDEVLKAGTVVGDSADNIQEAKMCLDRLLDSVTSATKRCLSFGGRSRPPCWSGNCRHMSVGNCVRRDRRGREQALNTGRKIKRKLSYPLCDSVGSGGGCGTGNAPFVKLRADYLFHNRRKLCDSFKRILPSRYS